MGFWPFKQKAIIFQDPKTLSMDVLYVLRRSLVSKLLLTNDEIIGRWEQLHGLSEGLSDIEDTQRTMTESAGKLKEENAYLKAILSEMIGRDSQSS